MTRLQITAAALLFSLLLLTSGCKNGSLHMGEYMYVGVPQVILRDRMAAIFNKAGVATLGEKVEVLEHQRRFVRIRTTRKEEGWVELRNLITKENFAKFKKLDDDSHDLPSQGTGVTRAELNIHIEPVRDSDKLYQLAEGDKVDILRRAVSERPTAEEMAAHQAAAIAASEGTQSPKKSTKKSGGPETTQEIARKQAAAAKPAVPASTANNASASGTGGKEAAGGGKNSAETEAVEPPPKLYDDFWLVRSKKDGHTGWVLARMIDLDVPIEVAQYAEGQRINGAYALNTVNDPDQGQKTQYLLLLNQPKDGLPYDFDQLRVFTWSLKHHRYETGYRERNIMGYFPVRLATQDFGRDGGVQPVFYVSMKNQDGTVSEREYRLMGSTVRMVGPTPSGAKASMPEEVKSGDSSKKKGKAGAAASGAAPETKKHKEPPHDASGRKRR